MKPHTCQHCQRLAIQPRIDYTDTDGATLEETQIFPTFGLNDVNRALADGCLLLQTVMTDWLDTDQERNEVQFDGLRLFAHYGVQSAQHWFLSSMGLVMPETRNPHYEKELDLHLFALAGLTAFRAHLADIMSDTTTS